MKDLSNSVQSVQEPKCVQNNDGLDSNVVLSSENRDLCMNDISKGCVSNKPINSRMKELRENAGNQVGGDAKDVDNNKINNLDTGVTGVNGTGVNVTGVNSSATCTSQPCESIDDSLIEKVANITIKDSDSERQPQEHPDESSDLRERGPGPNAIARQNISPNIAFKPGPNPFANMTVDGFPDYQIQKGYSDRYMQGYNNYQYSSGMGIGSGKRRNDMENDPAIKYMNAPPTHAPLNNLNHTGPLPSFSEAYPHYAQELIAPSANGSQNVYIEQGMCRNDLSQGIMGIPVTTTSVSNISTCHVSSTVGLHGGTVTMKTPDITSQEFSFSSAEYDSLLKNLTAGIDQPSSTQPSTDVNIPIPAASSNTSWSMAVNIPSPTAPSSSGISSCSMQGMAGSPPNDSGMDTASECSPYSHDSEVYSPPPSNMSVDSGVEKSPMSVLSPENALSPAAMITPESSPLGAGTSPPRSNQHVYSYGQIPQYTKPMDHNLANGFSTPQTTQSKMSYNGQFKEPAKPAGSVLSNQVYLSNSRSTAPIVSSEIQQTPVINAEELSAFVSSHLSELHEVLTVCAEELMEEQKKKKETKPNNGLKPLTPTFPSAPQPPPQTVAPAPTPQPGVQRSAVSGPVPVFCQQQPIKTQTMPQFIQPQPQPVPAGQVPAVNPPVSINPAAPVTNAGPQHGPIFFTTMPTNVTASQPMQTVFVPVTAISGGTPVVNQQPIVIVCPQGMSPVPQKQVRKTPRLIAPKLPYQPGSVSGVGPGSQKSNEHARNQPGQEKVMVSPVDQNRPPPGGSACPQQVPQVHKQQNLLNLARRTVADISSSQLRYQDEEGDTYLHVAVCRADKNMVQALLERLKRENLQRMVDLQNKDRQTPLYLAAADNQPAMAHMFISFGADVNIPAQVISSDGRSMDVKAPIHCASSGGKEYERTLQELLKAKDINVNNINSEGQTALHCAILSHGKPKKRVDGYIDSVAIVDMLIKHGADPNAQDKKNGKTPLMYAIEGKDYRLVEALIRLIGADRIRYIIKTQTFDGRNCTKIAEGLKGDYGQQWPRLWQLLSGASNGEIPKSYGRA